MSLNHGPNVPTVRDNHCSETMLHVQGAPLSRSLLGEGRYKEEWTQLEQRPPGRVGPHLALVDFGEAFCESSSAWIP